ncbi:hypothetical protein [Mycobacterium intracellulare]|uniref:hypothetical protein n=1 Tax=Mycobacterium intracellulare TaxID=1767 RepID=UPI00109EA2EE|nr:hypothetical protein [Mycobacterium intracellulare]
MSDDELEAVQAEIMSRIRDEIGSPPSQGPTDADPLGYLSPKLREWWLMNGTKIAPTLILKCADCHAPLGEIVSDADDPDLAVVVLRRVFGESQPVDFQGWSPGAVADQLGAAGGEAPTHPAARSLIEHLRERQSRIDDATLRILSDGRRITRRYREPSDVLPLDLGQALCPKHGWIALDPQALRAELATTRHAARRKIAVTAGSSV